MALKGPVPVALALLFAGCAAAFANIRVVQHGRVAQPLARIYVVLHQGPADDYHAQTLSNALVSALAVHTMTKATILNGLELDDRALRADIAAFQADGVLVLRQLGAQDEAGGRDAAGYLATLFGAATDRSIWQATIVDRGVHAAVADRSNLLAKRVVDALAADGLIRAAPQP